MSRVEGTVAEVGALLKADVEINRQSMHDCLNIALDFLLMIQDLGLNDQDKIDIRPAYAMVGDRIKRTLTEEECGELWRDLMDQLVDAGGMSHCHAWPLAHTIQHIATSVKH